MIRVFDTSKLPAGARLVRYKTDEPVPPGRYFLSDRRLPRSERRVLGAIAATYTSPGSPSRYVDLLPPYIYVRRALAGFLHPEPSCYGVDHEFDGDWPERVRELAPQFRAWQRAFLLDAQSCLRKLGYYRRGAIVRMGGGKTLLGLCLASRFPDAVVFAPRYLHQVWRDEATKWGLPCPRLSTYESAKKVAPAPCVIVDEANAVGNPCAQRTQAVAELADGARCAVALTGTPLSVSPMQVRWINAIYPGMLPPGDGAFRWTYGGDTSVVSKFGKEFYETSTWLLDKLASDISPVVMTVDISELLSELPPIEYRRVRVPCPKHYPLILAGGATGAGGSSKVLSQALTASDGFVYGDAGNPMPILTPGETGKVSVAGDLVENAGEPVFVVAHWSYTVEMLADEFNRRGIRFARIGGKDSDALELGRFTTGAVDVLLCPFERTKGLNLQRCRITVVVSNGTSPLQRAQMEARTYRPGQTRGCIIMDLCADGTLDDRRLDLLVEHKDQNEKFVEEALKAALDNMCPKNAGAKEEE